MAKGNVVRIDPNNTMGLVASQLTAAFQQLNAQLGKLNPQGLVLVAYVVEAVRPQLTFGGGVHLDIKWIVRPPSCLAPVPGDRGRVCLDPATYMTPDGVFLCDHHRDLVREDGRQRIADVVAALQAALAPTGEDRVQ